MYRQWRRLVVTLVPVVLVFCAWDLYAIHRGAWWYDARYITGLALPGTLPIEELLFFLVIPVCAILTYEAVLSRPMSYTSLAVLGVAVAVVLDLVRAAHARWCGSPRSGSPTRSSCSSS